MPNGGSACQRTSPELGLALQRLIGLHAKHPSLIATAFLFHFGTSAIRGFATTLTIGLAANVFTAVFASRTLFDLALGPGRTASNALGLSSRVTDVTKAAVNVARWGTPALLLSLGILGAGAGSLATRGLPLGIDFSGGTLMIAEFDEPGVTEHAVRDAVATPPGDEIVQRYGTPDERRFLVRLPLAEGAPASTALEEGVRRVTRALEDAPLPGFHIVERELVSAAIGEDLQRRGVHAAVASIVAITLYIGVRFRAAFAIGAMVATFHDILITLACLSLAGYDLSLKVTAALLTVLGYSVNDTIVIFDRMRENARALPGQPLAAIVNLSVRQTLPRTAFTVGTTLLSVLSLYAIGGDALRGFAFTMLVGILSGTWSTVFIASALATRLSRDNRPRWNAGRRNPADAGVGPPAIARLLD